MTISQALSQAAHRVHTRKRMIVLYWFCHTVIAVCAAMPILGVTIPALAHSSYAASLLRQFDYAFITETVLNSRTAQGSAIALFLILGAATLIAGTFLAGGAVKLIVRDAIPYSPREFWSGCGEYFWRLFRLMLYSLFFFAIANAIGGTPNRIAAKLWGEGLEGAPITIAGWVSTALKIILFGYVATAMDYAKVRLISGESRKSLRACLGSLWLLLRHPGKPLGAWVLIFALGALALALYQPLANHIEPANMGLILLLALWQQIYIISRVYLRFLAWGAAAELDPVLRPKPEPPIEFVPPPTPEPVEDFSI